MEWQNIKDQKPKDNQIVLASINGIYKLTRFDEGKNGLIEIASNEFFSLIKDESSVYWTKIEKPDHYNLSC